MYSIYQDGGYYETLDRLSEACGVAEGLLSAVADPTTFIVVDKVGRICASYTNRRIMGTFIKKGWVPAAPGASAGVLEVQDEDEFDATDAVLLLPVESLMSLCDGDAVAEAIGNQHIEWGGPSEVKLVEQVCLFFGIDDMSELTPELVTFVRQAYNPQPLVEEVVELTVRVKVKRAPYATVSQFVENLDYMVASQTPGVVVCQTEISSCSAPL